MCNEKGLHQGDWTVVTEPSISLEPQKEIAIKTDKNGFDLSSKGYGEDFLLKLVAQLQGKEVQTTTISNMQVGQPKDVAHKVASSIGELVSKGREHASKKAQELAENVQDAPQDEEPAKVNKDIPESLKARASQSNTELVYKDKDSSNTIGDKMIDLASGMYKVAGVSQEPTEDGEPDYFRTGIKYDQYNRPKFRTHYDCPKCGHSGRHYLPIGTERVSCHQCLASLKVEPATDSKMVYDDIKDISQANLEKFRDEDGYFYVADILDIQTYK